MNLLSCSTVPEYKPVVDISSINAGMDYEKDYLECKEIVENVDYSSEKTAAALKGTAKGVGVAGLVAGTVVAAGGILTGGVAYPVAAAITFAGGSSERSKTKTKAKEQEMIATVWNSCLKNRGYTVLSERG